MACVFCELMATGEARWVAREPDAVAFAPLPAEECAPGHTLVAPRRHAVGVHDADERDVVAVAVLVRRVSRAMLSALGATRGGGAQRQRTEFGADGRASARPRRSPLGR